MANQIILEVVLQGKNIKLVQKEVDAATNSLNKNTKAQDSSTGAYQKGSGARNSWQRQEKGVGQITSNSTKAFSKQAQTIGGTLVPAYAVLAANIFAIGAAFSALSRAAEVEQLTEGLQALGGASGIALKSLSRNLQEATGNALSLEESMRSTQLVISSGFDSSTLERLGAVAKNASIALGRDTADALARLTRGATKLEPELLDELGIMVRLDEASEAYADQIGKTAGELSNYQKRQAFMNAVLAEGEAKFGAIGDSVDPNPFTQLAATFQDLTKVVLGFVNFFAGPLVSALAGNAATLFGVLVVFGSGVAKQMIPALATLGQSFSNLNEVTKKVAANSIKFTSNISGLPPALQKNIASINENNASISKFEKLIVKANRNLEINSTNYNKNRNSVKANTAALEKNQARISANKTAINQMAKSIQLLTNVKIAETEQIASLYLEEGNYKEALNAAKQAMSEQIQNTKTATKTSRGFAKAQALLRGALLLSAGAARLAAIAFIQILPFIGTIIIAFGLLFSAVKAVWEFFKSDATKKLEKDIAALTEKNTELAESFSQISAARKGENSSIKTTTQLVTAEANALNELSTSYLRLNTSMKEAGEENPFFDPRVDFFQDLIKNSEDAKNRFEELAGAGVALDRNFIQKSGGPKKALELLFKTLISDPAEAATSLKSLGDSFKSAQKPLTDFYNASVPKTPYDDLLSKLQEVQKQTLEAAKVGGVEYAEIFNENASAFAGPIAKAAADSNKFILGLKSKGVKIEGALLAQLEENNKVIQEGTEAYVLRVQEVQKGAQLAKLEVVDAKRALDFAKQKTATQIDAEKQAEASFALRRAQAKELDSQQAAVLLKLENQNLEEGQRTALLKEQNDLRERSENITNNIFEAEETGVLVAQNKLNFLKQEQAVKNAVLDTQRRSLEMSQRDINLQERRLRAEAEARNNEGGLGFTTTAQDEAAISEALLADRKTAIEDELAIKKAAIDLEYDMLDARYAFLQAQTELFNKQNGVNISTTALEKARNGLQAQRMKAQELADEESKVRLLEATNANNEAKIKGEEYLATLQQANAVSQVEALQSAMNAKLDIESKILAAEKKKFEEDQKILKEQRMMENLKNSGIREYKLTAQDIAEFEKNATTQKLKNAKEEERIALQRIDMEYNLLDAKLKLAKAEASISTKKLEAQGVLSAEDSKKITDSFDTAIENVSAGRSAAVAAVEREFTAVRDTINNSVQRTGIEGNQEATGTSPIVTGFQAAQSESGAMLGDPNASTGDKVSAGVNIFAGMAEDLAKLGPQGELISAVAQGAMVISDAWQNVGTVFSKTGEEAATGAEKFAAVAGAAAATFGAIGQMQKAQSEQQVKAIDAEIAAEKNRDGKSKESLAKIAKLEQKKDQIKRKAFEQDKKMKIAQAVMSTAQAIATALAGPPGLPWSAVFAGMAAVMGAAQIRAIQSTSYQGGGSTPSSGGMASQVSVGQRKQTVDLAKSEGGAGELAYLRGQQGTGSAENFKPAFTGAKYRAEGGPTAGYVVGEQGPELFVPESPGRIVPNNEIQPATPINANINISAVDAAGVEEVLVKQRGNIIGMIREAANSYGENFMEEIDTAVYTSSAAGARRY